MQSLATQELQEGAGEYVAVEGIVFFVAIFLMDAFLSLPGVRFSYKWGLFVLNPNGFE